MHHTNTLLTLYAYGRKQKKNAAMFVAGNNTLYSYNFLKVKIK